MSASLCSSFGGVVWFHVLRLHISSEFSFSCNATGLVVVGEFSGKHGWQVWTVASADPFFRFSFDFHPGLKLAVTMKFLITSDFYRQWQNQLSICVYEPIVIKI